MLCLRYISIGDKSRSSVTQLLSGGEEGCRTAFGGRTRQTRKLLCLHFWQCCDCRHCCLFERVWQWSNFPMVLLTILSHHQKKPAIWSHNFCRVGKKDVGQRLAVGHAKRGNCFACIFGSVATVVTAAFLKECGSGAISLWFCLPSSPTTKKSQLRLTFFSGGRGWIRTIEAEKQQIYSLPPLATRELSHI